MPKRQILLNQSHENNFGVSEVSIRLGKNSIRFSKNSPIHQLGDRIYLEPIPNN